MVPAAEKGSNFLLLGMLGGLVARHLLRNGKGSGFISHLSNMPVDLFHKDKEKVLHELYSALHTFL